MIAKLIKGKSFRSLADYLWSEGKGTQIVASNMAGTTPRQLSKELASLRQIKPTLGKAVCHISLSISPTDIQLTNETWGAIAQDLISEMGFGESPFVAVKHNDTDHQHIHIMTSRIKTNGMVVSDKQDFKRCEDVVRKLEAKYGLIAVLPSNHIPKKRRRRKPYEKEIDMNQQQLQNLIDHALATTNTMVDFIDMCEKNGATLRPNLDGTRVKGMSYQMGGEWIKASELGSKYKYSSIAEHYRQNPTIISSSTLGRMMKQDYVFDNQVVNPLLDASETEAAKRQNFDDDYFETVWTLFKDDVVEMPRKDNGLHIRFKNGGCLSDYGNRIFAKGLSDKESAEKLVKLAQQKGWKSIQFKGNSKFLALAMEQALKVGIKVIPLDMKQQKILDEVQRKLDEEKAVLVMEPKPSEPSSDEDDAINLNTSDAMNKLNGHRALQSGVFEDGKPSTPKNKSKIRPN